MIVGVDISTHRIDLAWLEDGKPQRWHQELGKGSTIDRIRRIRVQWPSKPAFNHYEVGETTPTGYTLKHTGTEPGWNVTDVCIEEPWGRGKALAPLHQVLGIVTRQAPTWARVAHVSSGDLRRAIGAKNTKDDAHLNLRRLFPTTLMLHDWTADELDALVACIGWSEILAKQDAA